MRRIPVRSLKVNSVVGADVYDSKGRLLIKRNSKIDIRTIQALEKFNIISIYIIDEYSPDLLEDIISIDLRIKAVIVLKRMAQEFTSIDIEKRRNVVKEEYITSITAVISEIVDELLEKKSAVIEQIDIRNAESYIFAHSVNVAIISVIMGIELNYDRKKLINLALAAILHDMGKSLLPRELLYKTDERTPREEELMRSHCELGYNYLSKYESLDKEVLLAVLTHHEKIDGSGFPKRLKGDKINDLSKIIALANFYDNFMASGYMLENNIPNNVLEEIMSYVGSAFDYDVVKVLFKKAKPFLKGTMVELSNGDIAIVEGTIEGAPLRPVVKVIKSDNEKRINKYINLVNQLDLTISKIVYYI